MAQSQLQSGAGVSTGDADVPEMMPEEWPDGWDDEEWPEERYEEYEDEEWEDDFDTNEDLLSAEGINNAMAATERDSVSSPVTHPALKKVDALAPRKTIAKGGKGKPKSRAKSNGLKQSSLKKSKELDMPPTPIGCEWRDADNGWTLWRCWTERDDVIGGRYKKERYVGYLGREAWGVMKQYDYETFIAIIGRRFRRHGGR